jgi:putative transposase
MIAVCVLPDHLHCLWRLPEGDANYSVRWKVLKAKFTHQYLAKIGPGGKREASRQIHREAAIWE